MTSKTHRAFFGDAEHDFALTLPLIRELERETNTPLGLLCERVFKRQFEHSHLISTIRFALIGGGTAPKRAEELVAAYASERPLIEVHPLAVKILEAVWFGVKQEDKIEQA